jgi:hypothetical protein
MADFTPLPDPPCGAVSPDGDPCASDSTVIVAAEHPLGNAMVVWRCPEHVAEAVETAVRVSPDSVVSVTPLAAIGPGDEPIPDPAPTGNPQLQLVR